MAPNLKSDVPKYKPRFDPLTLPVAVGAAGADDDAIAVDFEEVKKNMKSHLIVIGRYLTTQIYSVRNLFVRMRQIWQLRGGIEEKELDNNKFLIRFEQKGDFDHVLKGGPWLYQDFPFLVAEYDGRSSLSNVLVNNMKIWVKIMELPIGMMTEDWARKMGNQLGTYKEVPKGGRRNMWADFYRIRIELDTTKPIKRWVKFQDQKTKEMVRYDVKYERMPTFCYYCGIIGHSDKNCMLPEEEKRVRFCVEQKASPYRDTDHRSYFLPAEPANVKKHLQFLSRSSADWKISEAGRTQGYNSERVDRGTEEEETETSTAMANPADVLQMVAAVGNLHVTEGKKNDNKLLITADQVTTAASNILQSKKWNRVYRRDQEKLKSGRGLPSNRSAQAVPGSGGLSPLKVPPIEDCLRSDGSLLQEIRADKARTERVATAFLKQKTKLLGKRPGCNDGLMQDGKECEKKARGEDPAPAGNGGEENETEVEATSHGAAGTLTGTEERACQEQ